MFSISPYMGLTPLLKAFMIIILGGMGSIVGAIYGGLIIGFLESFVSTLIGAEIATIIGFAIIILMLLIRPQGLLGHD